mgnify:CR=1 FL=1
MSRYSWTIKTAARCRPISPGADTIAHKRPFC